MTPFRSELKSEFITGTDTIMLTAPLLYWCHRFKRLYEVPAQFVSDVASIPRILWVMIGHPFDHRWRKESVLHDWFYQETDHDFTRKEVDQIYYDGLRDKGVGYFKAQSMYLGLRAGGWVAWNKYRA